MGRTGGEDAPWEWDLERLVASLVIGGDENGFARTSSEGAVRQCVETYRQAMSTFASRPFLDTWYARLTTDDIVATLDERGRRRAADAARAAVSKARSRTSLRAIRKIAEIKEAGESVLERHLGTAPGLHPGERVVTGQRLMQAASDPFLGWSTSLDGSRRYYWRQLWDMKGSADIGAMRPRSFDACARVCAWTLARAHARSGSAAAIAAYIGRGRVFADAMVGFALRYAAQNATDHVAHRQAIADGVVESRPDL